MKINKYPEYAVQNPIIESKPLLSRGADMTIQFTALDKIILGTYVEVCDVYYQVFKKEICGDNEGKGVMLQYTCQNVSSLNLGFDIEACALNRKVRVVTDVNEIHDITELYL